MLRNKPAALLFSLSPLAVSIAHAQNDSLSLNGFSGLFNVPNAHVTEYGTGIASYSDMMFYQGEYRHNDNVVGSFGLLPHVEISGRIAWFKTHKNLFIDEGEPRDLSANIKINIPFIPDNWFELAIGEQDIGGEANYFDARYIVASRTFGPLRIDIGAGQNDLTDRLDGVFGGIELMPYEWVSLIAEYDAQDTNTGFRLSTPSNWFPEGFRVDLTVLADTSHEFSNGRSFYGVNVKFPLGGGFTGTRPAPVPRKQVAQSEEKLKQQYYAQSRFQKSPATPQTRSDTTPPVKTDTRQGTVSQIAMALQDHGFDRVSVGMRNDNLYVAIENNIYNRSEIDALGAALAIITKTGEAYSRSTLILLNQGFPVIAIDTNPIGYQAFLRHESAAPIYAYYPKNDIMQAVSWKINRSRQVYPKPRITVSPVLNSGIATEYGVWDYSLGAAINGSMHLWKGAVASATYTQELDSSEDFQDIATYKDEQGNIRRYGGPFRNARVRNEMKEMTIQQGFRLHKNIFNNFHLGTVRYDYSGFQNQTVVHSYDGRYQVGLRFGDFSHDESEVDVDYQLLNFRYYVPTYDVAINATAGKFWAGDEGFRIDSLFRFGDQTVELFYKSTEAPDSEAEAEFIGIAWTLPLTLRKDWDSPYLQVKGHEAWRWGMQTRINSDQNLISFGSADVAKLEWEVERVYLNNDKLSPEYIYQNLGRLREANTN